MWPTALHRHGLQPNHLEECTKREGEETRPPSDAVRLRGMAKQVHGAVDSEITPTLKPSLLDGHAEEGKRKREEGV